MLDLNLDEYNPEAVETSVRSGGQVPPGHWPAKLIGCSDKTSREGRGGSELVFEITGGPHAGAKVKDTVWSGDKPALKNRQLLFANRLGLVTESKDPATGKAKYKLAKPSQDFAHCVGAEVIIKTVHEKYERRDGGEGTSVKLDFAGIFRPGEVEIGPSLVGHPKGKAEPAKSNLAEEI